MNKLSLPVAVLLVLLSACAQSTEEAGELAEEVPTRQPSGIASKAPTSTSTIAPNEAPTSMPTAAPYAGIDPAELGCAPDEQILYLDDFNSETARKWMTDEWAIVKEDGIGALRASNGGFSRLLEAAFEKFRLTARLHVESGGFLLYYLTDERVSGGYALYISQDGGIGLQDLSIDPPETGVLARRSVEFGGWHVFSLVLRKDTVTVEMDGSPIIVYVDPDPPEGGGVALELIDPSAVVSVDYISQCTIGEQVIVEAPVSDFVTWEKATSPPARSFSLLSVAASAPETVYATSAEANLWRSTDGGGAWEQVGERQFGAHIFSNVVIHPKDVNTVFTSNGFLYVTRDGGKNWEGLFGSGDSLGVVSVAFSLANPDVMYAGDDRSRLHSSQDSGRGWNEIGQLSSGLLTELWVDPADSNLLLAGTQEGLFRSEDGGRSFVNALNGPIMARSLTGDVSQPGVVYIIRQGRLLHSADRSQTWEPLSAPSPISITALGDRLYIGTDAGVMRSSNGGAIWESTGYDPAALGSPTALVVDPTNPDRVYSASEQTLAYSKDGGETWTQGQGLVVDDFFVLALDPANPDRIFAGLFWTLGMYRSNDGAKTWEWLSAYIHTPPGHEHYPMAITLDPRDADVALVTGAYGFRVTRNGGQTWTPLIGEFHMHGLGRAPSDPDVIYVGNGLGDVDKEVPGTQLFKSTDGGVSWQEALGWPREVDLNIYVIVVSPDDPDVVYVGTNLHDWSRPHPGGHAGGHGLLRSRDGGQSFEQINVGLTETNVFSMVIAPGDSNVIYVGTASQGRGSMFKSNDAGDSWVEISSGLPDMDVHSIALWPTNSDVVVVGLAQNHQSGTGIPPQGAGVWVSEDGGMSWADASSRLVGRGQVVLALAFTSDGAILYAGTNDGIYRGRIRTD